ncbi:MAG: IS200/IS605 family transposase [Gemmataceae bacterium]
MPQSLARIVVHLVFSTKNREPYLTTDLRTQMFKYLAGTLNGIECPTIAVDGVADHVHALFVLGRTWSPSNVVEELKKESSKWAKQNVHPHFYWQNGYAAFSVSPSNVAQVRTYIETQEEHHRRMTFQDELRELLRRHEMEWDERYVWD